jgi:hypothetical protein
MQHYGAILKTYCSENDYQRGLLDGADMILRTLKQAAGSTQQQPVSETPGPADDAFHRDAGPRLVEAFTTILEAESDLQGKTVRDLRPVLQRQIADLAATPATTDAPQPPDRGT